MSIRSHWKNATRKATSGLGLKKFQEEEMNNEIPPPSIYFSLPEGPLHIVCYSLDIDESSKITKINKDLTK